MASGILNSAMKKVETKLAGLQSTLEKPADSATKAATPAVKPVAPATASTQAAATPSATAPQASAASPITPVTTQIDPTKETVAGQVESIIKKDSPLMELAGTRAKQSANSRGLLNSSMAVQAGEAAVLDAAMPMASQDASTYARNRETNQATENQFKLEQGMQELRGNQAKELAAIEAANQQLLQTNQNAAALYQTHTQAVAAILANPDIPMTQKTALVARQNDLLKGGLAIAGSIKNVDFGKLLDFKSMKAGTTKINGGAYESGLVKQLKDLASKGGLSAAMQMKEIIKNNKLSKEDVQQITGTNKFNDLF